MVLSPNKPELFDLNRFSKQQHFLVAYSGGADSTALLHFCAHHPSLKHRVRAIHINHQLQDQANDWQHHCQQQCQDWQIQCIVERVILNNHSENAAREARRQAFAKHMGTEDMLLTGHHQQDQVETVLFRLLRGTGLRGLGGIQYTSRLPSGQLIHRPMLGLAKDQIINYLHRHHLSWVEDPSNQSDHFSRNHIRHHLLPEIASYSAQSFNAISESAEHLQSSHDLLMSLIPADNPIELDQNTTPAVTFLHHWLHKHNVNPPSHKQLTSFVRDCEQAAHHKHPTLVMSNNRLVYWQQQYHLLTSTPTTQAITLKIDSSIQLACGGRLTFSGHFPPILAAIDEIQVRYNLPGVSIKLSQHAQHKRIKKLHQEHKTAPWDKAVTPFLYHNDDLLAVGNWRSEDFEKLLLKNKCDYSWQKPKQIL